MTCCALLAVGVAALLNVRQLAGSLSVAGWSVCALGRCVSSLAGLSLLTGQPRQSLLDFHTWVYRLVES